MNDVKRNEVCSDCGITLSSPEDQGEQRAACPKCGSTNRSIILDISETVSTYAKICGSIPKGPGEKRPKVEFISGDDYRKSKKDWVDKKRLIDRTNDHYVETIKDKATGEIIHHCDELLSEHQKHGSEKYLAAAKTEALAKVSEVAAAAKGADIDYQGVSYQADARSEKALTERIAILQASGYTTATTAWIAADNTQHDLSFADLEKLADAIAERNKRIDLWARTKRDAIEKAKKAKAVKKIDLELPE